MSESKKSTVDPNLVYTISEGKKSYQLGDTFYENRRAQQKKWLEEEKERFRNPDPGVVHKYLGVPGVKQLAEGELEGFICRNDAALVMFYGETDQKLIQARKSLIKVASQNQSYGAVDCERYGNLCQQHEAYPTNLPQFNLYVGGRMVGKYNYDLSPEVMVKLLDRTPPPTAENTMTDAQSPYSFSVELIAPTLLTVSGPDGATVE